MEGVLRQDQAWACHTRLVVSTPIMSNTPNRHRPQVADRASLHEFQHSLAGLAQTPFVLRPAHGLAMPADRQLRNHARAFDPQSDWCRGP